MHHEIRNSDLEMSWLLSSFLVYYGVQISLRWSQCPNCTSVIFKTDTVHRRSTLCTRTVLPVIDGQSFLDYLFFVNIFKDYKQSIQELQSVELNTRCSPDIRVESWTVNELLLATEGWVIATVIYRPIIVMNRYGLINYDSIEMIKFLRVGR